MDGVASPTSGMVTLQFEMQPFKTPVTLNEQFYLFLFVI